MKDVGDGQVLFLTMFRSSSCDVAGAWQILGQLGVGAIITVKILKFLKTHT